MQVSIKKFDVQMELKNNGIELGVRKPNDGEHLGDLVITKTKLIWCKGQTPREGGISVEWADFIEWMEAD